jgi:hypothetical protein
MMQKELELLQREMTLLLDANKMLDYSYEKCKNIGSKETYTLDELDKFEALTSRFARVSDILIQKIFRLLDILELEQPGSVIDRIHRSEKREVIASADIFKEIRYLRNDIAHEYVPDAVEEIFKKVLELTPFILKSVQKVEEYVKKRW